MAENNHDNLFEKKVDIYEEATTTVALRIQ